MSDTERPKRVQVEFSEDEKRALRELARADGVTMAAMIRALIREETKRRGLPWPPSP